MGKAKNSAMLTRFMSVVVLTVTLTLAACATGAQQVSHDFSFDGQYDGWAKTIDLLEYSYGDKYFATRNSLASRNDSLYKGESSLGARKGVNGPMPVGDFMYVKWRIKVTGEILEDRVDLRDRLPRDMKDHGLTFVIDGKQLYLYVLTPQVKKSKGELPILRTWLSKYNVGYEIYPTSPKR
ncbi:MAG: hypothetical protein WAW73_06750 [Rhodoferax sp.]